MTDLDLAELDALMAAATPEPCEVDDDLVTVWGHCGSTVIGRMEDRADALTYVALRNAWPALRERLAAAEADRAELERLRRVEQAAKVLLDALDARDNAYSETTYQSVSHSEYLAFYAAEERLEEAAQVARAALHGEETT